MDYTVHGILQVRTLEWVAISFSRGPSQNMGQTWAKKPGGFFTIGATREAPNPAERSNNEVGGGKQSIFGDTEVI